MNIPMMREKLFNPLCLMRREVVSNNVYLAAAGLAGDHAGQERYKLFAGVPISSLTNNLSSLGVQGRIQRDRSVPVVFKPVALRAPRRHRQHRILSVQSLNRRLLINAKDRRMLRWIHVEGDDVSRFPLEIGR